jgi:hypothetical protein
MRSGKATTPRSGTESEVALAMAVVVGLASGLYPAVHCTKINPSLAIRES